METTTLQHQLRRGRIMSEERAPNGVSAALFVDMPAVDGGRAVAKMENGNNEVAAYIINEFLGWELVPVTVYRSYQSPYHGQKEKNKFMFQKFMENTEMWYQLQKRASGTDRAYQCTDEKMINLIGQEKFDTFIHRLELIKIFDYLIANTDRHEGNMIVNAEEGKLWAIDHAYSLEHYNDGEYSCDTMAKVVKKNVDSVIAIYRLKARQVELTRKLRRYLEKNQIEFFIKRLDNLILALQRSV